MIISVVVVKVEEIDADLVVEVEIVDDHIVLIARKMIMKAQTVL
jgi:hypothetical protein